MLDQVKALKGYRIHGQDGDLGKIVEFYFDDHHWTVRYLVVETGNWLTGRQVLISPYAVIEVNRAEKYISVNLTKKQIEDSPPFETHRPVSRQFEESYYGYYGYPYYWGGASVWGYYPYIQRDPKKWRGGILNKETVDSHLRSTSDVSGHHIAATDGEIGHVSDFIIDDESWSIRYLVVDTRNWWPGKKVLVSPVWIDRVSWGESKVFLLVPREKIRSAPEFTEMSLITRNFEARLFHHYGHRGYWMDDAGVRGKSPGLSRRNGIETRGDAEPRRL